MCIDHTAYRSAPHNAQYQCSVFDLRSVGVDGVMRSAQLLLKMPIPFSQYVGQVGQYTVAERPLAVAGGPTAW